MTVTIAPAVEADVAAVRRLVLAAYAGYVDRIGRRPAPMDADYHALVRAGRVWVATAGGELVGVLVLETRPDHLLIDNVAVAPGRQGTGIGRALLDWAEQRARAAGLAELRLYTNARMVENVAYYPRRGFTETRRARADGFDRVFFTKRLAAGTGADGPGGPARRGAPPG